MWKVHNVRGDRTSYTQRMRSARYSFSVLFRVSGLHQICTPQPLYDSLCVSTCPWWVLEALKVAEREGDAGLSNQAGRFLPGRKLNVPCWCENLMTIWIVGDVPYC